MSTSVLIARLYLVRHAEAGKREEWVDADRWRPLSERGRLQADHLVKAFAEIDVRHVASSPYDRCVQTIQPLALSRGLEIETTEALAEDCDPAVSRAFVRSMAPESVLCSHGDVIPMLLHGMGASSLWVARRPECEKGSAWAVQVAGGSFVVAHYIPPPG